MYSISSEALDFAVIHLSAKKLLYLCDIAISRTDYGVLAQGHIRFGPFTSDIEIKTVLDKEFQFISYEIEAKALRFWQRYEFTDGRLYFSHSKGGSELTLDDKQLSWWDPLTLLLQVRYDLASKSPRTFYHTFSKNKFSALMVEHRTNVCHLLKDEKPLVSLLQINEEDFSLKIDKLNVALSLSVGKK